MLQPGLGAKTADWPNIAENIPPSREYPNTAKRRETSLDLAKLMGAWCQRQVGGDTDKQESGPRRATRGPTD